MAADADNGTSAASACPQQSTGATRRSVRSGHSSRRGHLRQRGGAVI